MTAPALRRATYEDVLNAPEHMIAEVIDGTLYTQARPAFAHGSTSMQLGSFINRPYRDGDGGPGGWIFLFEPELHLGSEPDILVPDLAGWRRERIAEVPYDGPWTSIPPDWICEVLSPSTQGIDRSRKMPIYLREQVRHAWLVDPLARNLEIYRHGGSIWHQLAVHHGDVNVRVEPFDAIEIPLRRLWDRW